MEHIVRCSSVATTNICKGLRFKRNVSLLLLVLLSINLLFGCGYEMIADEHLSFAHTISESKKSYALALIFMIWPRISVFGWWSLTRCIQTKMMPTKILRCSMM